MARHRRKSRWSILALLASAAGINFVPTLAHAQTYIWDPSTTGSGSDGSGNWNTSASLWASGGVDSAWPNTSASIAQFGLGGAAGTVTVSSVIAGGLNFALTSSGGYTIGSYDTNGTITLQASASGSTPVITNNNTTAPTTINSDLAGSDGVIFNGAGYTDLGVNYPLAGNSQLFGGITVNGTGTLEMDSPDGFGMSGANVISINNSTLVTIGDSTLGSNGSFLASPQLLGGLSGSVSSAIFQNYYFAAPLGLSTQAGVTNSFAGKLANASGGGSYLVIAGDGTQSFSNTVTSPDAYSSKFNLATGSQIVQGTSVMGAATYVADHTNTTSSVSILSGTSGLALNGGTFAINGSTNAGVNSAETAQLALLPGASSLVLAKQTGGGNVVFISNNELSNIVPYVAYNGSTLEYTEPAGTQSLGFNGSGNGWDSDTYFESGSYVQYGGTSTINSIYAGIANIVVNENPVGTAQTIGLTFATKQDQYAIGNGAWATLVGGLSTFDSTSLNSSAATYNVDQASGSITLSGATTANTLRINGSGQTNIADGGNALSLTAGGLLVTQLSSGGSIRGAGSITAANASFFNANANSASTDNQAAAGGELIVSQYSPGLFTIGDTIADAPAPAADPGAATAGSISFGSTGVVNFSVGTAVAPGMLIHFSDGSSGMITGVASATSSTSVTSAYVYALSAGTISAGASISSFVSQTALVKSGPGDLQLSGTNTYHGTTFLDQGVLRLASAGALPTTSGLWFAGGVLGLGDSDSTAGTTGPTTFTESIGNGAGQVQWIGNGGFASYNASGVSVNINANAGNLTWGSNLSGTNGASGYYAGGSSTTATGFVGDGLQLLFGAATGQGAVTFANPINLNDGDRTITVTHATANGPSGVDAILTGALSNGALTKDGNGVLQLAAANTYTGLTTVSNGTLIVSGSIAAGQGVTVGSSASGFSPALEGTGTISSTVEVLGSGSGGSAGTLAQMSTTPLTLTGLELDPGASVAFSSISTTTAAFTVTGTLNLMGTGINLTGLPSTADGNTYDLFTFGSLAGAAQGDVTSYFTGVPAGDSVFASSGVVDIAPTPEPASSAIVLIGASALLSRRRRRARRVENRLI